METEPNVRAVAKDFLTLFTSFRDTYFLTLSKQRLPSKSTIEFLLEEIDVSKEKIGSLKLGECKAKFEDSYEALASMIRDYVSIETRDIAQALGVKSELPETNDLFEIAAVMIKQNEKTTNSQFLQLVDANLALGKNYEGVAMQSAIYGSNLDKICGTDKEPKIGSPLRERTVRVIEKLDRYFTEAIMQGNSITNFLKGTEKLIKLCRPSQYLYQ